MALWHGNDFLISALDVVQAKCKIKWKKKWFQCHLNSIPLQWRHNEHDGISNHQPHDCLINHLFRHRSKKTSKICVTGLCEGNSPVSNEFPAQRASNVAMFPFDDVIMRVNNLSLGLFSQFFCSHWSTLRLWGADLKMASVLCVRLVYPQFLTIIWITNWVIHFQLCIYLLGEASEIDQCQGNSHHWKLHCLFYCLFS